jgi:hypothetical protein
MPEIHDKDFRVRRAVIGNYNNLGEKNSSVLRVCSKDDKYARDSSPGGKYLCLRFMKRFPGQETRLYLLVLRGPASQELSGQTGRHRKL